MATFLTTFKFTEKGIANIKDTCERAKAFRAAAKKMKVKVVEFYWTLGPSDGAVIIEAPDDETATALLLQVGSLGNVQTQTVRAFKAAEMEKIVAKM